jgi:divalent metal cation (Fe/Co/Zn/Cd) transporter
LKHSLEQQHRPETTLGGIVVSLVSMSFRWLLIHHKTRVGTALISQAILADAACSKVCVYLSIVLLVASAGYEMTGIGSLDALGALLIAWLSWKEGKEAFDKARGLGCSCSGNCG